MWVFHKFFHATSPHAGHVDKTSLEKGHNFDKNLRILIIIYSGRALYNSYYKLIYACLHFILQNYIRYLICF